MCAKNVIKHVTDKPKTMKIAITDSSKEDPTHLVLFNDIIHGTHNQQFNGE